MKKEEKKKERKQYYVDLAMRIFPGHPSTYARN